MCSVECEKFVAGLEKQSEVQLKIAVRGWFGANSGDVPRGAAAHVKA